MKPTALKTELATLRKVMEQIAAGPRRTREQRLAASCLSFLDAMRSEKARRK
jgi:hypothetical protein